MPRALIQGIEQRLGDGVGDVDGDGDGDGDGNHDADGDGDDGDGDGCFGLDVPTVMGKIEMKMDVLELM